MGFDLFFHANVFRWKKTDYTQHNSDLYLYWNMLWNRSYSCTWRYKIFEFSINLKQMILDRYFF